VVEQTEGWAQLSDTRAGHTSYGEDTATDYKLCVWWSVADEGLGQQPVVVSAQPAGLPAAITEIHVTYPASLPDPAR